MGIIAVLLGIFILYIGITNFKNAKANSETNPNISVDTWRTSGAICIFFGVLIIVCGMYIAFAGNISNGSTKTVTKTNTKTATCQSCGRSFSDSTEMNYIKWTNMCKNCYRNYCYATGQTPANYDR